MEKKVKAGKMSEEEKKKVTEWFQEARNDRSLSRRSMEERYPLVYAMTDSNQQEPQQEEQPKEDETIASTDSSAETPPNTVDSTSMESTQQNQQPPMHRVSSKQRRLSFEEYRSVYLPVPKIENRMPVFISASLRDELDKIARRLGGKRMSASGLVENMVKHHLITYGDELKEWYKL